MGDRRSAIREAFVDDLQTVIVVDDQFPSFQDVSGGEAHKRTEASRAVALWKGFRELGMVCEIENDPRLLIADHLKKADLVVLDYHLTGDHDDGAVARNLLKNLAEDGRQHLAIVYTSDPDVQNICLRVAATVAGIAGDKSPPLRDDQEEEMFSEWVSERKYTLPSQAFAKYLQRDLKWYNQCVKDFKAYPDKFQLKRFFEKIAYATAVKYGAVYKVAPSRLEISLGNPVWVRCDNVFTVVIQKGHETSEMAATEEAAAAEATVAAAMAAILEEEERSEEAAVASEEVAVPAPAESIAENAGEAVKEAVVQAATTTRENVQSAAHYLRERLVDALLDWNPSFLRVMLNHARHCIVEQGFIGDDHVLRNPKSEAGWLLFMNTGTPEERQERLVALYGRLFEDLVIAALHKIEAFSAKYDSQFGIPWQSEGDPGAEARAATPARNDGRLQTLSAARSRAHVEENVKDEEIVHNLNDFLAFEEQIPPYVRTGTVFVALHEDGRLDKDSAWICTTPDCDLVPRVPDSGWGRRLHPYRPALCRPVSLGGDIGAALKQAEDARALFRRLGSENHVIQLLADGVGHRRPEMVFMDDSGRIDQQRDFGGRTVIYDEGVGGLELQPLRKFRVVGQLRARYAMRLLHEAGHHLSRIGVDFVDWPPRNRGGNE